MNGMLTLLTRKGVAAIGVAVATIAVTLTLSSVLKQNEDVRQAGVYDRLAEAYAARIRSHISARLELAEKIEREFIYLEPQGRYAFGTITNPILDIFNDIQALNWIDPQGVIRWVTPIKGNENAINLDLMTLVDPTAALTKARTSNGMTITPPIELAQGGQGFAIYKAINMDADRYGFLNLVFRTGPLLQAATQDIASNEYGFTIRDAAKIVHQTVEMPETAAPVAETIIPLADRKWQLTVLRVDGPIETTAASAANVLMLAGILATALLSVATHLIVERQRKVWRDEARFRDFARINSDWFFEMDEQLRYSYFSDRFKEVVGADPADYIGKTRTEVGAPGTTPEYFQKHLDTMARHEPFFDFVHYREHPEHGRVYIAVSGVPVFEDGVFQGYRCTGRDISREREQAQELERAMVAAELASQAKSEFLATMSHELRTPLNAILGFSEMIRHQYFGPLGAENYREYADDIHSSGEHLLSLINDVLDISAIEAKKRSFDLKSVNVEEMLSECTRYFDHVSRQRAITVDITHTSPNPIIEADEKSVRQIFLNIMSNAIKFNVDGGRVEFITKMNEDVFTLEARDTGVGIEPDALTTVTEPFSRQHSDPLVTMEGTGLGLSIVKALVDEHGGDMDIKSTVGVGTTISINMPVRRAS